MLKIRVTKLFTFEMAHALWNYDGACRNIHGHSYKLYITIIGEPCTDTSNPKLGMVMDFGDLKRIVHEEIVSKFDHSVVIGMQSHHKFLENVEQMFDKYYVLDYQPTCENLVSDIAKRIQKRLPEKVSLFSVKLAETATSYAEWFASDNQ
ncbi:MAG: 6-carboxytetrahydropterin synthase [Bacteroidota bacterium]|nr:6-carboxytetrahydropterin synthase [Bacteroidota bacterium]MDP4227289.1 6-carboxytetrahydropterin synthase [Bacteroidota bacterium]MDP4274872.1 6-carboxytetrahydropterin synthase [Bacteroidota bacterium]